MRKFFRATVILGIAAAGMHAAGPAQAAAPNSDFGQHVSSCGQMMEFGGIHNPGMHEGKSGWEPDAECSNG